MLHREHTIKFRNRNTGRFFGLVDNLGGTWTVLVRRVREDEHCSPSSCVVVLNGKQKIMIIVFHRAPLTFASMQLVAYLNLAHRREDCEQLVELDRRGQITNEYGVLLVKLNAMGSLSRNRRRFTLVAFIAQVMVFYEVIGSSYVHSRQNRDALTQSRS